MSAASIAAVVAASHALSAIDAMPADAATYHRVTAAVHSLCVALHDAERAAASRAEIESALTQAWTVHGKSSFIRRLQCWPRGYQGDYETIDYLMGATNRCPPDTVAYHLERMALSSPISQQHRNKMHAQAAEIRRVIAAARRDESPRRILSIASGSSPDLESIREEAAESGCRFVITDADAAALDTALGRLGGVPNVEAVGGNIFRTMKALAQRGPYDLVTAGGLYDYLSPAQARLLTAKIFHTLLAPGGRFFFTNIATGNPYRIWIEHLARWIVFERSEEDMRALMAGLDDVAELGILRDATSLTWIVSATRAH